MLYGRSVPGNRRVLPVSRHTGDLTWRFAVFWNPTSICAQGICKWRAGKALRARHSSQRLREIRGDEGGTYERVRTDERLEASSRSGRNSSLTPDEHRLEQTVEIHEKRIVRTGER